MMLRFLKREWAGRAVSGEAAGRARDRAWAQLQDGSGLKEEWDTAAASSEALLRARNSAWQHLHRPVPARQAPWKPVWAGAALAMIAAVAALLLAPSPEPGGLPTGPLVELPARAGVVLQMPVVTAPPVQAVPVLLPEAAAGPPAPLPERVVVQMRLPSSGTRMIWIKDRNFDISGGLK